MSARLKPTRIYGATAKVDLSVTVGPQGLLICHVTASDTARMGTIGARDHHYLLVEEDIRSLYRWLIVFEHLFGDAKENATWSRASGDCCLVFCEMLGQLRLKSTVGLPSREEHITSLFWGKETQRLQHWLAQVLDLDTSGQPATL